MKTATFVRTIFGGQFGVYRLNPPLDSYRDTLIVPLDRAVQALGDYGYERVTA